MKKLPKLLKNKSFKRKKQEPEIQEGVPRITNETVAEHREQVLGSARKYIYPLQHSKHRIVIVTTGIILTAIVAFFTYSTLALYRLQTTSTFIYRVTQVVPFPIARSGGQFIAYENYLFELRHYMHYFEQQQKLDFTSEAGKAQLAEYKQQALKKVIDDAYVKRLASQHHISVSNAEVEAEIDLVRSQNRLGGGGKVFEDVLKDYWGWSVDDFKRSLQQQLLAQKVAATLDTATNDRAKAALAELKGGADFAAVAKKYSDDTSNRDNGGDWGFEIDKANRDLPAETTAALFKLHPGQTSEIINIGYALEIVKTNENTGDRVKGAHILFNFKSIDGYINDLKEKQPARLYLQLPEATTPTTPTN
jgi:hypothetical protein